MKRLETFENMKITPYTLENYEQLVYFPIKVFLLKLNRRILKHYQKNMSLESVRLKNGQNLRIAKKHYKNKYRLSIVA